MKKKILLADDDKELNEGITEILTDEGFEVCSVNSGTEAVRKAVFESFDLAVLDYKMPGLDGLETLAELRKKDPALRAIMISGKPFIENITENEGITYGIAYAFSKPFDIPAFIKAVKKTCR